MNYFIGRTIGPRVFTAGDGEGLMHRLLNRKHLDRAHEFFEKHGGMAVVLSRFAPIIRTFVPFVAGAAAMNASTFLLYNVAGGVLWTALCVGAGYAFGNVPIVKDNFSMVAIGIVLVSLIPLALEMLKPRRALRNPDGKATFPRREPFARGFAHYDMKLLRASIATIALAAVVVPAEAQDRIGITLAAGALGRADPAPQGDFITPLYAFSVQGVIKRYFVIEGELGMWSHTLRVEQGPHDIFGPAGVIGRVEGTTIVDAHRTSSLSVHLLVRSTGNVRIFAGGGADFSMDNTEYRNRALAVRRRWTAQLRSFRQRAPARTRARVQGPRRRRRAGVHASELRRIGARRRQRL